MILNLWENKVEILVSEKDASKFWPDDYKQFLFSPLSTRCGFRSRLGSDEHMMETESVYSNTKVSKNLLSLFNAGDSEDEFDLWISVYTPPAGHYTDFSDSWPLIYLIRRIRSVLHSHFNIFRNFENIPTKICNC